MLTADSPQGLQQLAQHLRLQLRSDAAADVTAVQRIQAEGPVGGWRGFVLVHDAADADAALAPDCSRLQMGEVAPGSARPAVLMFPGLGEHYVHMGLGLYRSEPVFRAALDHAAEILQRHLNVDVRTILYPTPPAGAPAPSAAPPTEPAGTPRKLDLRRMLGRAAPSPDAAEEQLGRTELLQPILFAVEWALAELLRSWGLRVAAMLGYSLGEYVTACLAGVLSLEDSLALVAQRAQLIAQLPAGHMLAVCLPESALLPLLPPNVSLSAVNGQAFCVAGGPADAIAALDRTLTDGGVTTRRVKTTHAFHSQMMAPLCDRLTALCRGYALHPPRIPYVSNVSGTLITPEQATSASYLSTHLCAPVRCADGFAGLLAQGHVLFVEAGPGQGMCSLAIQQQPSTRALAPAIAIPLLRSAYDSSDDRDVLLTALGKLWLGGADLDWARIPSRFVQAPPAGVTAAAQAPAAPSTAAAPETTAPAPDPALVDQIARVWGELFRGAPIHAHSHFRDLGGTSLTATRLVQRLSKIFGIPIPLPRMLRTSTVADQARLLASLLQPDRAGSTAPSPSVSPSVSPSPVTEVPAAQPQQIVLPNGMRVFHQSAAETAHFYRDIFEHRSYLTGGLTIPDYGTVFDVGANMGLFTLFAAQQARGVQVYSFEPAPPMFDILQRNVQQHQVAARLFNYGLSNADRTASFTFYPRSSGMSSFYADVEEEKGVLRAIIRNQQDRAMPDMDQVAQHAEDLLAVRFDAQTFQCRLRRLSDVVSEQRVAQIDLLKIDVQKAELEVLQGIADADWPKIRQIAIEVHDTQGRVADITALLQRHGYRVLCAQDDLYQGTNLFNLFAARSED